MFISDQVRRKALDLDSEKLELPAYIYDLSELRDHAEKIKSALSASGTEFFYAAKANPDPELLRALDPYVAGFEVASGGELAHVRRELPDARIAFGGPGKTDWELAAALDLGVDRLHIESPNELARLISLSDGRKIDILLRANLNLHITGAVLAMSGPFGMDETGLVECVTLLKTEPNIRLRGIHTHLASGLNALAMLQLADQILDWALPWLKANAPDLDQPDIVLGGGMAVDYGTPEKLFDWQIYGAGLAERKGSGNAGAAQLRIEPGRSVSVYCGYYVTDVLDVKWTHGQAYVVLRGGTHHIRTPATKGHSQPFKVIQRNTDGLTMTSTSATLVGQLCTPKDVLAKGPVSELQVGDLVAFTMAGAYAWNISHTDFLMHPKPEFYFLN
jgi:diaminopimelate decarboxylase